MKYIKKPLTVEAIQLPENGDNIEDWIYLRAPDWFIEAYENNKIVTDPADKGLIVETLEGAMLCHWGGYIIRGEPCHELYPCFKEVFELTYMPVH